MPFEGFVASMKVEQGTTTATGNITDDSRGSGSLILGPLHASGFAGVGIFVSENPLLPLF